MGSDPCVLDISSDEEEEGFGWRSAGDVPLGWFAAMLGGAGDEKDDVIELDGPAAAAAAREENLRDSAAGIGDGSDDECIVLDGDPDGGISVVGSSDRMGGDESDELLIVGEKGELACRDYPHSRHSCANFPFSTTPHESYCSMCHCYVCDSPAPCNYWGDGVSSTDHCHSTDKEAKWQNERESFKQRNMPAGDLPKLPDSTLSIMSPIQNPQPIHHIDPIIIPTLPTRSGPPQVCSATRGLTSAIISQRHHQHLSGFSFHGQRLGQHLAKTHPMLPRVQSAQRERRGCRAHSKFKYVGIPRGHLMNLNSSRCQTSVSGHNQIHRTAALQIPQCPLVTLEDDGVRFWQDILAGVSTELGVAEETNTSTTYVQPHAVSSQSSTVSQFHSQLTAAQDTGLVNHSIPTPTNTTSLGFDSNWLTDTAAQNNLEYEHAAHSNSLVFESNLAHGGISIGTFLDDMGQDTVSGPEGEWGLLDMDPGSVLDGLDGTWSTFAQV